MSTAVLPAHLERLEQNLKTLERQRMIYSLLGLAALVAVVWFGISIANNANATPFSTGIGKIFDYPVDMIVEAWAAGWSWPSLLARYLPELLTTLNMALFSTFIGFGCALVMACCASANLMPYTTIVQITRRTLDLMRSFPELVIAMVFLYLMGKSVIPAVIAITIHTTGALGKLFSEAIENVDPKPLDGLRSVGGSWSQRVRFGVLPQVLPLLFSYALLRLEINVRASTILGFVGAGGIGEALSAVIQWRYGAEITAIMTLLILTIVALDYLSGWIRDQLIGGVRT